MAVVEADCQLFLRKREQQSRRVGVYEDGQVNGGGPAGSAGPGGET